LTEQREVIAHRGGCHITDWCWFGLG